MTIRWREQANENFSCPFLVLKQRYGFMLEMDVLLARGPVLGGTCLLAHLLSFRAGSSTSLLDLNKSKLIIMYKSEDYSFNR
ncbi:MAG TPA: hypothetical protein VMW91_11845 [Desulfosporosinus sp.]|nr:hypothetical protein [Desulfosporosinus sp.]